MNTVLVTGAANGLGKALCHKFLKEGWTVVGIDKTIIQFEHQNLLPFVADITNFNKLHEVKEQLTDRNISISTLINNAGIFRFFPITDAAPEELEMIVKVNTLAPFNLINLFREDLVSHQGRVVQISSENIKLSGLFQPYPSSKIALESLSVAARQELSLLGVKLIIVRPGAIKTGLLKWNRPTSTPYQLFIDRFFHQAHSKMSTVSDPEKVADLVFKAATCARPGWMYSINQNLWLSLFSRLPARLRERLVLRMLK